MSVSSESSSSLMASRPVRRTPTAPYGLAWDTRAAQNGAHTLTARARDAAGNTHPVSRGAVNVANANFFQNEVLATGFNLPTNIEFLPDGRMLVVELAGTVRSPAAAVHDARPDTIPADHEHRVGRRAARDLRHRPRPGLHDEPLLLRLLHPRSHRTATGSPGSPRTATIAGTVPGSETVLYQDPIDANAEHHGGVGRSIS